MHKGNEMTKTTKTPNQPEKIQVTEFVDHFCFNDFTGKTLTEAAVMLMALDNMYRSENIEVFFDLTKNGMGYALLGSLCKTREETQKEANERNEFNEYLRLKAKFD